jgi:predicted DNA-binding protein with PD1-like motif
MLRDVTLAFWTGKEYKEHKVPGPAELLSLQGNFSLREGKSHVHCHAVLGLEDGSTVGGHLSKATVHETNEIYIRKLSGIVMERKQEPSGLWGLYPHETGSKTPI